METHTEHMAHVPPADGKQPGPVVPEESDDSLLDDTDWLDEPETSDGIDGACEYPYHIGDRV